MTNHADLIAALRIPLNVTLRNGAPELDEYDEQRKAAADALEDAWAEATAAAYEVALKAIQDAPAGYAYHMVEHLTPRSARDWLAAHDAEVYRRGQEDMRQRAADAVYVWSDDDDYQKLEGIIRTFPIKEKDDE